VDAITIQLTISLKNYKQVKPLAERLNAEVRQVSKQGVPVLFKQIRKRYALMIGMILTLAVTWVFSLYIWDIQIEGNQAVSNAEIRAALREVGVDIGAFGLGLDSELIRNEVLLYLEDVEWLTVNVNGSRATVIVRERMHPPVRFAEDVPTIVYAAQNGIIEQMIIWEGAPLVEVGDTVDMGQELITGRMDSLSTGTRFVRADGEIFVRTWYEFSMSMPLEHFVKVETGEISTKSTIIFGQSRINLFFDSGISYVSYDKIVKRSDFVLPGGIVLPIRLERRIYTEHERVKAQMDETRAALLLQEQLLERLAERLGPQGEVLSTEFTVELQEGIITVHLVAECREQIAQLRKMREDEMIALPPIAEEEAP